MRKYDEWTHGAEEQEDGDGKDGKERKRHRKVPMAPVDVTIRTLFVGGVDWSINEDLVRNKLKDYGSILSVTLLPDRKCGFVTFATREEAEGTMTALFDQFYLNKRKLELNWARSKGDSTSNTTNTANTNT